MLSAPGEVSKNEELIDFHKETLDVAGTMNKMAEKLEEIDQNGDPRNRVDVIIENKTYNMLFENLIVYEKSDLDFLGII